MNKIHQKMRIRFAPLVLVPRRPIIPFALISKECQTSSRVGFLPTVPDSRCGVRDLVFATDLSVPDPMSQYLESLLRQLLSLNRLTKMILSSF